MMLSVPADDKGKFAGQSWMIDTYHFSNPHVIYELGRYQYYADAVIEEFAARDFVSSSTIFFLQEDCFYNACVRLNEQNAKLFTEVCDLREWVYVFDDDISDYDEGDLCRGIHLYRDQGHYSWGLGYCGITLRRKSAEKDPIRYASTIIDKMSRELPRYDSLPYKMLAKQLESLAHKHRDDKRVASIFASKEREIEFFRRVASEWDELRREIHHPDQMSLSSYDGEGRIESVGDGRDE